MSSINREGNWYKVVLGTDVYYALVDAGMSGEDDDFESFTLLSSKFGELKRGKKNNPIYDLVGRVLEALSDDGDTEMEFDEADFEEEEYED